MTIDPTILAYSSIIIPAAFVVGGLLLGLLAEQVVLRRMAQLVQKTGWRGDEILIASLRGFTFLWFFLAGVYYALQTLPLISETIRDNLSKLVAVILIGTITFVTARIAGALIMLYVGKGNGRLAETTIFSNLTRLIIFSTGFLVILQYLGIPVTPLLTALGVGGLAVALALQETLGNLFSGLHIIASRRIKPGDYVKLDSGDEGYVQDITWRNTIIRTLANNLVIIPNSKTASMIFTNYHLPVRELSVVIPLCVGYESDLTEVERITLEVGRAIQEELEGAAPDFQPLVRYNNFGESGIDLTVTLRAREFVAQYLMKHEFIKRIHKRYREEGIVIPYPIRSIYVHNDGDRIESRHRAGSDGNREDLRRRCE